MNTIVGSRTSRVHRLLVFATVASALVLAPILSTSEALAAETLDVTGIDVNEFQQVVGRSIDYLRSRAAEEQGSLSSKGGTGITSLCVAAVLAHRPSAVNDPAIKESLAFLEKNVRPDGGIYSEGSTHRNYETCLAIAAFVKANKTGQYNETLKRAEDFVKGIQWDQGEGIETDDPSYGGAGYGSHKRPDLSNTAFMIDALHDLGRGADDEAIQKALIFVSRTQNLESPANDTVHAAKENDGGFYYTPAAGGESQAGKTPSGGLRSYGSMTYAGLKSMLYAGVDKDDPRVKAAMDFIEKTYTLEQNPGMGAAGLYYYYHTFAKSLSAAEVDVLTDATGTEHNWRAELFNLLASKQADDGSFVNEENPRWMEGDRALVTGYALLALAYCQPTE
jgi:squalene-hopene/tetraprenyl-beta-curcumene cyclase